MKGRKPKPTELKRLAGNPGNRPLNEAEPQFGAASLRAPHFLKGDARLEWVRLAPVLAEAGVLTEADEIALAILCQKFVRLKHAWDESARVDPVHYTDKGNAVQHPWVSMVNRLEADVMKVLAEFGMSPSSRTRIQAPGASERSLAEILFDQSGGEGVAEMDLEDLVGVRQARVLKEHGLDTVAKAQYAQQQGVDLTRIKGIGPATVDKLRSPGSQEIG